MSSRRAAIAAAIVSIALAVMQPGALAAVDLPGGGDGGATNGSLVTGDSVTDALGDAVADVGAQIGETTGPAVDDSGSLQDDGSSITGPVGDTIGGVLPDADTVEDTTGAIDQVVTGTTEVGLDPTLDGPAADGTHEGGSGATQTPPVSEDRPALRGDAAPLIPAGARRGSTAHGSLPARQVLERTTGGTTETATTLEAIARAAAEVAKVLAFPAALIGLVALFLALQNRIDRNDPKLAAAPVDADHQMVTFE